PHSGTDRASLADRSPMHRAHTPSRRGPRARRPPPSTFERASKRPSFGYAKRTSRQDVFDGVVNVGPCVGGEMGPIGIDATYVANLSSGIEHDRVGCKLRIERGGRCTIGIGEQGKRVAACQRLLTCPLWRGSHLSVDGEKPDAPWRKRVMKLEKPPIM